MPDSIRTHRHRFGTHRPSIRVDIRNENRPPDRCKFRRVHMDRLHIRQYLQEKGILVRKLIINVWSCNGQQLNVENISQRLPARCREMLSILTILSKEMFRNP